MDGFAFDLLDKVTDSVSGFGGAITGMARHLHHPRQYLVEGLDTTGRPISEWLAEERLTKVEE